MRFSDIAENEKKNVHDAQVARDAVVNRLKCVPEVYDGIKEIRTRDMDGVKFKIEMFHIVTKPDTAYNKETRKWEVKTSKKSGKVLTITLLYVKCISENGDDFYFCTRSQEMIKQLNGIVEGVIREYESVNGPVTEETFDVQVDDLMRLASTKVEYADGQKYDQPILTPAE